VHVYVLMCYNGDIFSDINAYVLILCVNGIFISCNSFNVWLFSISYLTIIDLFHYWYCANDVVLLLLIQYY